MKAFRLAFGEGLPETIMNKKIVIFGATSAIAYEAAKLYAKQGCDICLIARDSSKLAILQQDMSTRYPASNSMTIQLDMNHIEQHKETIKKVIKTFKTIDIAIIAHGTLSNQQACQNSVDELMQEYQTNCLSYLSLLSLLGNYFEKQQKGSIVAITSVAGDRGRQSNYVYGSAKAAVTAFLSGLRGRLAKKNVHILTVKPGFVDTPMVAHLEKNFLFAKPEKIALDIRKAINKRKQVIYTPGFWRWIMLVIKLIPESIFKSMKI